MAETLELWEILKTGLYDVFISTAMVTELLKCAEPKRTELLELLSKINYIMIEAEGNGEIIALKDKTKSGYFDCWLDIDANYGPDFGKSNGYMVQGSLGTQKVRIINTIDKAKFWRLVYDGLSFNNK